MLILTGIFTVLGFVVSHHIDYDNFTVIPASEKNKYLVSLIRKCIYAERIFVTIL